MKNVEIVTSKVEMRVVNFHQEKGKAMAQALLCNPNFGKKEFRGFKPLGKATELTEEDWKGIVDDILIGGIVGTMGSGGYWAYATYDKSNLEGYETATESGLSLLKANGVVLENEFRSKPAVMDYAPYCEIEGGNTTSRMNDNDWKQYETDLKDWREAESKVWRNCHVFIKNK